MELEFPDFTSPDEMSSVTLVVEGESLYVHREVLAAWSPVFRSMFTRDFKEKDQKEVELPGKKVDDFVELLHCMYPPIKPISGELGTNYKVPVTNLQVLSRYFVVFCSIFY